MTGLERILLDLGAEHDDLDDMVSDIDAATWDAPTPAAGWGVRDQIAHLGLFDRVAAEAMTDPDGFGETVARVLDADPDDREREMLGPARALAPDELLAWWREARAELLAAAGDADPKMRVPWFGPPMSMMSFLTARLMETWAHGQDVADAVGVERAPSDRLVHVAHLGVITRGFSYRNRGLEPDEAPVRVELAAPSGDTWSWGPDDAPDRIEGDALDFCLVVTQRRHPDDTGLVAVGAHAEGWLAIAQAFAGPPGPGREPQRVR